MRYQIRDRESGNVIDEFETLASALVARTDYEIEDSKEGTYTPGFYEVYDTLLEEEVQQ